MAPKLTGYPEVVSGDTTSADSTKQTQLGTRVRDTDGNEYIYLTGTASTSPGNWVTFDENYTTTRVTADSVGTIAIARVTTTAGLFGYYQVYGYFGSASVGTGTTSTDVALYLTSTAGFADAAPVTGDIIVGAYTRAANSGSAVAVWINYPFTINVAIA